MYLLNKNKIMKKLFEISSEEKQRILEMHESATKKNYLNEQQTASQKQPEIKNFDLKDVITKWETQKQGVSGSYYWFSETENTGPTAVEGELSLYALKGDTGSLHRYYDLAYNMGSKTWGQTTYPPSGAVVLSNAEILKTVIIDNPNDTYSFGNEKIDQNLYSQYVKQYVTKYPNTPVAKAFKLPSKNIVADKYVRQTDIDSVKKSPLYVELNATESAPTSTNQAPR